jgi:hypothetical protein
MIHSIAAAELHATLGPDLSALVRDRPAPLRCAAEVSTLRQLGSARCAILLEFADGTRLKGRRFDSVSKARRAAELLDAIGADYPRIVARRGDALLLEWIEGSTLSSLNPLPPATLSRCGTMLGRLHTLDASNLTDGPPPAHEDPEAALGRTIDELGRAGVLDADRARRALEFAAVHRPSAPSIGIVHQDFCAENLVQDASGAVVCIDNATLDHGPHDFDLARTWYRWPMNALEGASFADGYSEHRDLDAFRRHFGFWATVVVVVAAARRHRMGVPGVNEALGRLEHVLSSEHGSLDKGWPPAGPHG